MGFGVIMAITSNHSFLMSKIKVLVLYEPRGKSFLFVLLFVLSILSSLPPPNFVLCI